MVTEPLLAPAHVTLLKLVICAAKALPQSTVIGNDVSGEEILVVVYDLVGKESYSKIIITEETGDNVYAIDPSNKLVPGIYLITATSKQSIFSKKLIVK